jgi:hypothetical protein
MYSRTSSSLRSTWTKYPTASMKSFAVAVVGRRDQKDGFSFGDYCLPDQVLLSSDLHDCGQLVPRDQRRRYELSAAYGESFAKQVIGSFE